MTDHNGDWLAVASDGDVLALGNPVEEKRELRTSLAQRVGVHDEKCTMMYRK
jgi:hypothetical protein